MSDTDVLMPEKVVESLLGENGDLIPTGSPCILCSPLPNHWRSNKSLPTAFKVSREENWQVSDDVDDVMIIVMIMIMVVTSLLVSSQPLKVNQ